MNRHDRVRVNFDGLPWPENSVHPHGKIGVVQEVMSDKALLMVDSVVKGGEYVWVELKFLEAVNE